MSGFQLGRVGIVLLGLYAVLVAISSAFRIVATPVLFSDASAFALSVIGWLGSVLVFGVLPAAILIVNRDRLSRRWFGADADAEAPTNYGHLLQVGLVLMALGGIWEGLAGLLSAGMLSVSLQSAPDAFRERSETLSNTVGANAVRAAAHVVFGTSLLWLARPLSRRLS